jgi:imidazole glycerol phosphate synthase subunit HisF
MEINTMPNMTNRPRLTSAQFLGAHRRALETISDLHAAIEEMPILAASNPTTMKHFFDQLADVQATAAKLAQHFRTQICTGEKNSNSF